MLGFLMGFWYTWTFLQAPSNPQTTLLITFRVCLRPLSQDKDKDKDEESKWRSAEKLRCSHQHENPEPPKLALPRGSIVVPSVVHT